ncbi:hypothetical protein B0T16DRAFT_516961, partial [Cercophora newfieldiana]
MLAPVPHTERNPLIIHVTYKAALGPCLHPCTARGVSWANKLPFPSIGHLRTVISVFLGKLLCVRPWQTPWGSSRRFPPRPLLFLPLHHIRRLLPPNVLEAEELFFPPISPLVGFHHIHLIPGKRQPLLVHLPSLPFQGRELPLAVLPRAAHNELPATLAPAVVVLVAPRVGFDVGQEVRLGGPWRYMYRTEALFLQVPDVLVPGACVEIPALGIGALGATPGEGVAVVLAPRVRVCRGEPSGDVPICGEVGEVVGLEFGSVRDGCHDDAGDRETGRRLLPRREGSSAAGIDADDGKGNRSRTGLVGSSRFMIYLQQSHGPSVPNP